MPAVDELLADLAAHPPTPPTPVDHIRGRARRRVRRRRAVAGVAAALVVAVAVVGLGAVVADDAGEDVLADGGPTTETTPPPASSGSLVPADAAVTLDPAVGHDDGTVVELSFAEPTSGPISVAQCAREVEGAGGGAAVVSWCVDIVTGTAEDPPPYTLSRVIHTSNGTVDCAEAPARCLLGVRVGDSISSTDDRFAPLVFRDDLPPPVEPEAVVDGDEGTVGDGDTLLVTVTGVATGDVVHVMQCREAVDSPNADEDGLDCASSRARSVTVQDGPETQLTFTAFHDILENTATSGQWEPGWVACEPCRLVVRIEERRQPVVVLPLTMEPTASPIRPSLELDPPGPHAPGEVVDVRVAGLQPSTTADIAWCIALPPQGGGDSPCNAAAEEGAAQVPVGEDGSAELAGFALPSSGVQGEDCRAAPGTCGIGIHDPGWFTYLALVPLDLGG